jgi:succinate dehydrogenase/fumarate reductase flavoprotein subunit
MNKAESEAPHVQVPQNEPKKERLMFEENQAPRRISRKDFVKGAATVAGVGALASCAPAATPAPAGTPEACPTCPPAEECPPCPSALPETWDEEVDVVVVGSGLAGLTAALTAKRAGADVLILEKAPEEESGGNSRVGGSVIWSFPDPASGMAYLRDGMAAWGGTIDDDMLQAWADEMVKNVDYLAEFGADFSRVTASFSPEHPDFAEADKQVCLGDANGSSPWAYVAAAVEEEGIRYLYETPGQELILDGGEVKGVLAGEGHDIAVKARRAVVLATGGFEANFEIQKNYLPGPCWGYGTPHNTGDGIKMVQLAGGALWHMNSFMGPNRVGHFLPDFPNIPWRTMFLQAATTPGNQFIFVDNIDGKRFMNELRGQEQGTRHGMAWKIIYWWDGLKNAFPYIPLWIVFDEVARKAGPIAYPWGWSKYYTGYTWSEDNSVEIEKGVILQADSIGELAGRMKVDAATLEATISRWNELCLKGVDEDFGRRSDGMERIIEPPFYAADAWPCMVNTQGGPKRNALGQIVNPKGEPIGRLYGSGEMGSIYGWQYNGGGNQAECLAFGRISGRNAAAEQPWE